MLWSLELSSFLCEVGFVSSLTKALTSVSSSSNWTLSCTTDSRRSCKRGFRVPCSAPGRRVMSLISSVTRPAGARTAMMALESVSVMWGAPPRFFRGLGCLETFGAASGCSVCSVLCEEEAEVARVRGSGGAEAEAPVVSGSVPCWPWCCLGMGCWSPGWCGCEAVRLAGAVCGAASGAACAPDDCPAATLHQQRRGNWGGGT